MAQPWAKVFYNSALWKRQRAYILKRDNYTCTEPRCHRRAEEVHHIIELNETNVKEARYSLDPKNLRSLCGECHKRITKEMHRGGKKPLFKANALEFDENGYPIPPGE